MYSILLECSKCPPFLYKQTSQICNNRDTFHTKFSHYKQYETGYFKHATE